MLRYVYNRSTSVWTVVGMGLSHFVIIGMKWTQGCLGIHVETGHKKFNSLHDINPLNYGQREGDWTLGFNL